MQSRYSAFAMGLGDYLCATIDPAHPDAALAPADFVKLARSREFRGLRVLGAETRGDRGEVVYLARVFARGADRSFAEVALFARAGGRWRYVDGSVVPRDRLTGDLDGLTAETVRAIASAM